ncbi:ArnT family glycosyltransferase [Pontibacter sp. MBLB2868]|uniref:ArnT family glycosyltransferase n=1 Tax=Pontibacter sp. MBLB2868 TaxID=3451555 RepID=UPI003F74E581
MALIQNILQTKLKVDQTVTVQEWLLDSKIQVLLLFLILGITYFVNLGVAEPGLMEARNFISAREMVESGHWLVPTLNGEVRLAKPPLPTWLTALSGMVAGDLGNVTALRFPAAVMTCLLVIFLFLLCRQLTRDKLIPFLAAAVLASSFGIFNVGREGTWDIYCHSFMVGGIWLLVKGWRSAGQNLWTFAVCGLLLGCSFLSKGPVAFFAMLLPFLISYLYYYGRATVRGKWAGMLLALIITIGLSMAWPLYIYFVEPEALARNVNNESVAWVNRHVKPFWYYWGFAAQTGVWTVFTVAALVVPYARKRISAIAGNYTFLIAWVAISVLLLSVIPEKKERYLLPAIVPLALLTGLYLRFLIQSIQEGSLDRWGKRIIAFCTGAFVLVALAFPVAAGILLYRAGQFTLLQQVVLTGGSVLIAYTLWMSAVKRKPAQYLLAVLLLNSFVLAFGFPLYENALHPSKEYRNLVAIRDRQELQELPYYAVDGLPIVHIWEVGKQVDTLRVQDQQLQVPSALPAVLFSQAPLVEASLPLNAVRFKKIETFHINRKNPEEVYHVYLLMDAQNSN